MVCTSQGGYTGAPLERQSKMLPCITRCNSWRFTLGETPFTISFALCGKRGLFILIGFYEAITKRVAHCAALLV